VGRKSKQRRVVCEVFRKVHVLEKKREEAQLTWSTQPTEGNGVTEGKRSYDYAQWGIIIMKTEVGRNPICSIEIGSRGLSDRGFYRYKCQGRFSKNQFFFSFLLPVATVWSSTPRLFAVKVGWFLWWAHPGGKMLSLSLVLSSIKWIYKHCLLYVLSHGPVLALENVIISFFLFGWGGMGGLHC
jgi:hypothetical protein